MAIRWLTRIAWAGMFVFGLAMALLGAILPLVIARLNLDLARAGGLFTAMSAAMLAAMPALGPLMDRYGHRPVLLVGSVLTALALLLVAGSTSLALLALALILLGAGGGALNGATNTLVADLHPNPQAKNAALNLLGVFFGVGALSIPLAIGRLIEALGLAIILTLAALVAVTPGLGALLLRFPPPKQRERSGINQMLRLARKPLVLIFGLLLFFQSGSEFIVSGYTTTYLTREAGLSFGAASYVLAAYWCAVTLMRCLLSRLLMRVPGPVVVRLSALATAACVLLLALARDRTLAVGAVIAVGASLAGVYPTVLGQAGAHFAARSGTVFGVLFAMALVGGMTLPLLVGWLAETFGMRTALLAPCVNSLGVFLLQSVIERRAARVHEDG